jgi:flagellar biogenesis protein FliO
VKILTIVLFGLTSFSAMAVDTVIKAVELKNDKAQESKLSIKVAGNLNENPQLNVGKNSLDIVIPGTKVNAKIVRHFGDAIVTATQEDRETVRVKVGLSYSLQGKESLANVTLKDGSIEVSFPRGVGAKVVGTPVTTQTTKTPVVKEALVKKIEAENKEAEKLDENYLAGLVKENEKLAAANHPEKNDDKAAVGAKANVDANTAQDGVKLTQSSVQKDATSTQTATSEGGKSSFSVSTYIGKFVAFLSLMVLGFYGVLTLFKKGVIKKGKLGFLHSTKMVEVLSTTHVAPKRTLMMVKAHKQVFLVSNTEAGMQLISEIQDVAGIIKTGEQEVTGSNFDTNLYSANAGQKEFKLKEDSIDNDFSLDDMLNESADDSADYGRTTNASRAIEKTPVKDQVRFSDQIKKKVKNMKQIQY